VRLDAPYSVRRTRFSYDALGRRTGSFDGRKLTLFIWDGLRLLREETGARAITYFYEQGGHVPLARVDGRNVSPGIPAHRVSKSLKPYFTTTATSRVCRKT
jgi:hypothetical protein